MLSGWTKSRQIRISNSSALSNYQIRVVINRSDGSSSGDNIYIGTECLNNYNDIRFTLQDDTELSYFLAEHDTNSAVFWVKIPSIVAGITTILLQYGNLNATTTSDGATTFPLFFEDFLTTLNPGKWTSTGNISIVDGQISITNNAYSTNQGIVSVSTFARGYSLTARLKVNRHDNAANSNFYTGFYTSSALTQISVYNTRTDIQNFVSGSGNNSVTISATPLDENWHIS